MSRSKASDARARSRRKAGSPNAKPEPRAKPKPSQIVEVDLMQWRHIPPFEFEEFRDQFATETKSDKAR